MRVSEFAYDLPPDRIATEPVAPRDRARLLLLSDSIRDLTVRDLPELL